MANGYSGNLSKYRCLLQRDRESRGVGRRREGEGGGGILMKLGECFIQIANSVLTLPKFFAS